MANNLPTFDDYYGNNLDTLDNALATNPPIAADQYERGNVLMQPDLLQASGSIEPKAGTYVDELGRVYSKETNQLIPETRRPNVLPVTRNALTGEVEFAMPRALDIVGNVMGGIVAPLKAAKTPPKLKPVEHNPFVETTIPAIANEVDGAVLSAKVPVGMVAAGVKEGYRRALSPLGLYSHAAEVAANLDQAKGTPSQFKAMLEKAGVRPVEFENAGFDDAFKDAKSVTKDDVAKLFADKMPELNETVLGGNKNIISEKEYTNLQDTRMERRLTDDEIKKMDDYVKYMNGDFEKYQQYTIPGGENYREVLMNVPNKKLSEDEARQILNAKPDAVLSPADMEYASRKAANEYKSSHWDQPNVVAHLRMSDREIPTQGYAIVNKRSGFNGPVFATQAEAESDLLRYPESLRKNLTIETANGKPERTLHLEELQSDWAQEGRKKGFSKNTSIDDFNRINNELDLAKKDLATATQNIHNQVYGMPYRDFLKNKQNLSHDQLIELDRKLSEIKNTDPEYQKAYKNVEDLNKKLSEANPVGKVPSGPYVTNTQHWTDLGLKRALKEAADGNYDRMVWTPGAEQAKRYSLAKQVDELRYVRNDNGTYNVVPFKNKKPLHNIEKENIPDTKLDEYFGKEVAEKMRSYEGEVSGNARSLSGQDLSVGGEGMKSYYDKIVPTRLKEIVKKIDPEAKIEMTSMENNKEFVPTHRGFFDFMTTEHNYDNIDFINKMYGDKNNKYYKKYLDTLKEQSKLQVPSIKLTPKLKEAIRKGLPAFSIGGAAALGVANSPNMRYNLKSVDHNPFEQKYD